MPSDCALSRVPKPPKLSLCELLTESALVAQIEHIFTERCVRRHGRTRTSTWMSDLAEDVIGHLPFSQLKFVGTHNSGTSNMGRSLDLGSVLCDSYTELASKALGLAFCEEGDEEEEKSPPANKDIRFTSGLTGGPKVLSGDGTAAIAKLPFGLRHIGTAIAKPWAKTQSLSLYEQLVAGYRYLDIRLITNETPWLSEQGNYDVGELWVAHGLFSTPHRRVVNEILAFARKHPREIFVLDYNRLLEMKEDMSDESAMGNDVDRARRRYTRRQEMMYSPLGTSGREQKRENEMDNRRRLARKYARAKRVEYDLVCRCSVSNRKNCRNEAAARKESESFIPFSSNEYTSAGSSSKCCFEDAELGVSTCPDETPFRRLVRDLQPLLPHIIPSSLPRRPTQAPSTQKSTEGESSEGQRKSVRGESSSPSSCSCCFITPVNATMSELWSLAPTQFPPQYVSNKASNRHKMMDQEEGGNLFSNSTSSAPSPSSPFTTAGYESVIKPSIIVTFPQHFINFVKSELVSSAATVAALSQTKRETSLRGEEKHNNEVRRSEGFLDADSTTLRYYEALHAMLLRVHSVCCGGICESQERKGKEAEGRTFVETSANSSGENASEGTEIFVCGNIRCVDTTCLDENGGRSANSSSCACTPHTASRTAHLDQEWHDQRTPQELLRQIRNYHSQLLTKEIVAMVREVQQNTTTTSALKTHRAFSCEHTKNLDTYVRSCGRSFDDRNDTQNLSVPPPPPPPPSTRRLFITGTIITITGPDVVRGIATSCFRFLASPWLSIFNRKRYDPSGLHVVDYEGEEEEIIEQALYLKRNPQQRHSFLSEQQCLLLDKKQQQPEQQLKTGVNNEQKDKKESAVLHEPYASSSILQDLDDPLHVSSSHDVSSNTETCTVTTCCRDSGHPLVMRRPPPLPAAEPVLLAALPRVGSSHADNKKELACSSTRESSTELLIERRLEEKETETKKDSVRCKNALQASSLCQCEKDTSRHLSASRPPYVGILTYPAALRPPRRLAEASQPALTDDDAAYEWMSTKSTRRTSTHPSCCNNYCGGSIFHTAREINHLACLFFYEMNTVYSGERWEALTTAASKALDVLLSEVSSDGDERKRAPSASTCTNNVFSETAYRSWKSKQKAHSDEDEQLRIIKSIVFSHWGQLCACKEYSSASVNCLWCRCNFDRNVLQLDYAEDAHVEFNAVDLMRYTLASKSGREGSEGGAPTKKVKGAMSEDDASAEPRPCNEKAMSSQRWECSAVELCLRLTIAFGLRAPRLP